MKILLAVFLCLSISAADAHSWYSKQCCDDHDCHPVRCEEVEPSGNGWKWHSITFDRAVLKRSQDGGCHVCVNENVHSGIPPFGICIYLPPES